MAKALVEPARAGGRAHRLFAALLLVVAVIALALWLQFPWGPIRGLAVEGSAYVDRQAAGSARQVAVVFSAPEPLQAVRTRKGAGFINAVLSVCDDTARATTEVVAQRAGYFPDEGRVRTLPPTPGKATGRSRYRAVFEDPRDVAGSSRSRVAPPPGELCFSLNGGSMWVGKLWSDRIRLTPSPAKR